MTKRDLFVAGLGMAIWCLPSAVELQGQVVHGRVVLDGWEEPVPEARVVLKHPKLGPVEEVTSLENGSFHFPQVEPGTYHLRAHFGDLSSQVEGPVTVEESGAPGPIVLILPSPLFELARGCRDEPQAGRRAVLAGVVFEAASEVPLAQATVRVQWGEDEEGAAGESVVTTDGTGRYVLCSTPAGRPVSAFVEAFGVVREAERDFVVMPGAVARLDVALDLGAMGSLRVVRSAAGERAEGVTVEGRVLDALTGTAVAAAAVTLATGDRPYVTGRDGHFRFEGVAPGTHEIAVRAMGYEVQPRTLEIPEAAEVELELRVSPEALELAPIVAWGISRRERTLRATPHAMRIVSGERLRFAEERGATIDEVLREERGVQVMEWGWWNTRPGAPSTYGPCIQSSRRIASFPGNPNVPQCQMVEVVLDGVPLDGGTAPEFLRALSLNNVESIEFLHPLEATRWGYEATLYGAVVIWTRGSGPHVDQARNPPRR